MVLVVPFEEGLRVVDVGGPTLHLAEATGEPVPGGVDVREEHRQVLLLAGDGGVGGVGGVRGGGGVGARGRGRRKRPGGLAGARWVSVVVTVGGRHQEGSSPALRAFLACFFACFSAFLRACAACFRAVRPTFSTVSRHSSEWSST